MWKSCAWLTRPSITNLLSLTSCFAAKIITKTTTGHRLRRKVNMDCNKLLSQLTCLAVFLMRKNLASKGSGWNCAPQSSHEQLASCLAICHRLSWGLVTWLGLKKWLKAVDKKGTTKHLYKHRSSPVDRGKNRFPGGFGEFVNRNTDRQIKTEVERKSRMNSRMNHIFSSMNRIVSPSVDESCTLPWPRREESAERTEDASHKWRLPSSTFVTRSLPLSPSFQWTVTNCSCRSEMYPYLRSAASFTACNHSQCEANRVKWSRQIMQRGHGVNCQWETAFTSPPPTAWKYHAAVMASWLPETW